MAATHLALGARTAARRLSRFDAWSTLFHVFGCASRASGAGARFTSLHP
jgi:hypothetical protein